MKLPTIVGALLLCGSIFASPLLVSQLPTFNQYGDSEELAVLPIDATTEATNETSPKDLYVIKAVIYEIGILTNVDENDTSTSNETIKNEQVDFTFFNTDTNGTIIDLAKIPPPIETNVTGQVITRLAPVVQGQTSADTSETEGTSALPLFSLLPTASAPASLTDSRRKQYNETESGRQTQING